MHDIDTMLGALSEEPIPAALADMGVAVMAGLGARQERDLSRKGLLLAACIAGTFGLALGIDGGSPASAEPLFGVPVSAPSQLLIG